MCVVIFYVNVLQILSLAITWMVTAKSKVKFSIEQFLNDFSSEEILFHWNPYIFAWLRKLTNCFLYLAPMYFAHL